MTIESILIWVALGAVAGWLASKLVGGVGFGLIGNVLIGIAGSFIGGWLAVKLKIAGAAVGGLSIPSIVTAIGGAVVLLILLKLLKR
ncbi:MAG TPA: GlsB/YeaQ/YmgE family stress response membrane protein [Microscillaceae bacterium]|nr:GlsB/YeaQ/YmgE family stress response membrane protein [Microscillaceae bacterium]